MIDQTRMSVSKLAVQAGPVAWSSRRPPVPVDAHWNDVWLAVTPIWAVLATGRVVFYALERIRYPADVPPVIADAIQALLLWPAAVLGCYLTIRVWRRHGFSRACLLALGVDASGAERLVVSGCTVDRPATAVTSPALPARPPRKPNRLTC